MTVEIHQTDHRSGDSTNLYTRTTCYVTAVRRRRLRLACFRLAPLRYSHFARIHPAFQHASCCLWPPSRSCSAKRIHICLTQSVQRWVTPIVYLAHGLRTAHACRCTTAVLSGEQAMFIRIKLQRGWGSGWVGLQPDGWV